MSVISSESKPWQIKKEKRRQERSKLFSNGGLTPHEEVYGTPGS